MKFETKRKIVHITEGSLAIGLVYYDLFSIPFMIGMLAVSIFLSVLVQNLDHSSVDKLTGLDRESKQFPAQGSIYLLMGFIVSVALFPKNIALASIVTATFGDSFSALVGKYFGQLRNPFNRNKYLEGTAAGFIISAGLNLMFLSFWAAIIVAAAGMIIESFDYRLDSFEIDDNFLVPVGSGLAYLIFETFIAA